MRIVDYVGVVQELAKANRRALEPRLQRWDERARLSALKDGGKVGARRRPQHRVPLRLHEERKRGAAHEGSAGGGHMAAHHVRRRVDDAAAQDLGRLANLEAEAAGWRRL